MKINPYFLLKEIDGESYLLPFGQALAENKRGLQLNESGLILWNALSGATSEKDLVEALSKYYDVDDEDIDDIKNDVHEFIELLSSSEYNILLENYFPKYTLPLHRYLCIADLTLRLEGPGELFHEYFNDFSILEDDLGGQVDLTISAIRGEPAVLPTGESILINSELSVLDCGDFYHIRLLPNKQLKTMYLKKDGSHACLFCVPPANDTLKEEIFQAARQAFLFLAQKHNMFAIHSTSVIYRDKAWLFSGHTGMGKSFQANLWSSQLNTVIFNGDINLISLEDGVPVIHGIPWCGTSGLYRKGRVPLGGITMLGRDINNHIAELPLHKQILLVNQRIISPAWTREQFDANMSLTEAIAPHILICRLFCNQENEAVYVLKGRIDSYLDS